METVRKGAALKYDCYAGSVFALFWVFTGRIKTPRNWFVNVSPKHQLTLHYTILKYIQINMFCCPIRPPTNLAFLFTSTGQQICYFTNTSKSHVFSYWRVQSFKTIGVLFWPRCVPRHGGHVWYERTTTEYFGLLTVTGLMTVNIFVCDSDQFHEIYDCFSFRRVF